MALRDTKITAILFCRLEIKDQSLLLLHNAGSTMHLGFLIHVGLNFLVMQTRFGRPRSHSFTESTPLLFAPNAGNVNRDGRIIGDSMWHIGHFGSDRACCICANQVGSCKLPEMLKFRFTSFCAFQSGFYLSVVKTKNRSNYSFQSPQTNQNRGKLSTS